MQEPENSNENKLSDLSNSAYMQDFSEDLEKLDDVRDEELAEILESKTQFVDIPVANQAFKETRELMQESRFVYTNNVEQLPSHAEYVGVPINYGHEQQNMHVYPKTMLNPAMYIQESQQQPLQSDNTFVHVNLDKPKIEEEPVKTIKEPKDEEEQDEKEKEDEKVESVKEVDTRDYESEINMLKADLEQRGVQLEAEIDKVDNRDQKIKVLEGECGLLKQKAASDADMLNEQRGIINKLEIEKESLLERIRMIQTHDETLTATKVEGLERENNRLMNEVQDKNQTLRDKEQMIERLNEDVFNLQRGQNNEIKDLELQLHKSQLTHENLRKQQDQLLAMVDELKRDLADSRHKNRELEGQYYAQNDTNHRLNAELEYCRNQIQVLKGQLNNSSSNFQNMSMQWEKAMKDIPANLENKMKMLQSEVEKRYVVPNINTAPHTAPRNVPVEPQKPLNPYAFDNREQREPVQNVPTRNEGFNRNNRMGEEEKPNKYELENPNQRRANGRRNNRVARHHHRTNRQDNQSSTQTNQQQNVMDPFNSRNQPNNSRFNQQDDDISMRANNQDNSVRNEGLNAFDNYKNDTGVKKSKLDKIPRRQPITKPTMVKTLKEKTGFEIEKEKIEAEVFDLQKKRTQMDNEFEKLNKTRIRSGALLRRKKELESDLLFINKDIAQLKNRLRILKNEYY